MIQEIIFGIAGGLALFLFGMKLLSEGLQKAAGNRLKSMLEHLTDRPIKGIFTGGFITSLIQSSSITTVTIVGLINAGIMNLTQSIAVIMGADIGTTITAQLVAFKVGKYALPIIAIGTAFLFLAKKKKYYYLAQVFLGFGILFLGMETMSMGAAPLREFPVFIDMLSNFGEVALLGVLAGAIFTGIIQSSSATTALIIAMSMEGVIGLRAAIAIIIGANIGTCVTALLASISTPSLSAKRAAAGHILIKIIGAAVFIPLIDVLMKVSLASSQQLPRQIANAHTIFNVITVFMLVPFIPLIVKILKKIVPGREYKIDTDSMFLDKRLLNTPAVAINQAKKELKRMAKLSIEMLKDCREALMDGKKDPIHLVSRKEEAIDNIHHSMDNYLKSISEKPLTSDQSKIIASMLHTNHDIERVGDHANNLMELFEKKTKSKLHFSPNAHKELKEVFDKSIRSYEDSINALNKNDKELALEASKLESRIDLLVENFESNHMERLKKNICNPESGVIFVEILRNLERISDHANNIASSVIF